MNLSSRPLLQVAVDVLNTRKALEIVGQIHPYVDIVEIGTPLIIEDGLSALEAVKSRFPDKKYLADLKIMDAGDIEATSAFKRGADIVTVLAAADDLTIRGALNAAERYGAQVMADLINVPDQSGRAKELNAMNVPLICLHTAYDLRDIGKDPLFSLEAIRRVVSCRLAIAGGLTLDSVAAVVSKGADILVVGGGIVNQADPREVARKLMAKLTGETGQS
jgi:3-hexulose-6-phosphate synthase